MKLPKNLVHRYAQLALALDDDVLEDAQERSISVEDARLRSETARQVLEDHGRTLATRGDPGRGDLAPTDADAEGEDVEWLGMYWQLRDAGWSWRQACYIAWAASPRAERWPGTQEDLATEVLGLTSPRVISTWRKKNPVIDEWVALMQAAPLLERRADVIRALVLSASSADYKSNPDRKLFFEMIGDYVPRSKIDVEREVTIEDLSSLSDAELDVLAARFLKGAQEREDGAEEAGLETRPTDDDDGD